MEKFYIKPNNLEESMVVAKWFDENHSSTKSGFYQKEALKFPNTGYTNNYKPGHAHYDSCPDNVTQITFDYFVKNILKKEQQHSYEIY